MSDGTLEKTAPTVLGTILGGPVGGAIAGGALELLGGLFGNKSAREQAAREEAVQREFAQNSIRWRVADAKAAGLHPLYALGGAGATYSPAPIRMDGVGGALSSMGQNLSRAAMAQASVQEREMTALQQEQIRASIRESDARAGFYNSEAARRSQAINASQPLPMEQDDMEYAQAFRLAQRLYHGATSGAGGRASVAPGSGTGRPNQIEPKAAPVLSPSSSDESKTAGRNPFWQRYLMRDRDGGRFYIMLPQSNEGPSETMENLSHWQWLEVIRENTREYGKDWLMKFISGGVYPGRQGASGSWSKPRDHLK